MVSADDARALASLARDSILSIFNKTHIDSDAFKKYSDKLGVFVTLKKFDELRGCIGYPIGYYPLYQSVIRAARSAAFGDPRFPKVERGEMDDITIEISILTEPKLIEVEDHIQVPHLIKIGRDGLMVQNGMHSGLLLPQVFTEYDATPVKALEMTCQKAGLDPDDWKDSETKIYIFSGQVFSETEPRGKIVEVM